MHTNSDALHLEVTETQPGASSEEPSHPALLFDGSIVSSADTRPSKREALAGDSQAFQPTPQHVTFDFSEASKSCDIPLCWDVPQCPFDGQVTYWDILSHLLHFDALDCSG
jgi:hypothetical protein